MLQTYIELCEVLGVTVNVWKCYLLCVMKKLFSVEEKNQLDVTFVFFISLLLVAQHVSGNHVPIIRS